jgi:hypothetical protein
MSFAGHQNQWLRLKKPHQQEEENEEQQVKL